MGRIPGWFLPLSYSDRCAQISRKLSPMNPPRAFAGIAVCKRLRIPIIPQIRRISTFRRTFTGDGIGYSFLCRRVHRSRTFPNQTGKASNWIEYSIFLLFLQGNTSWGKYFSCKCNWRYLLICIFSGWLAIKPVIFPLEYFLRLDLHAFLAK